MITSIYGKNNNENKTELVNCCCHLQGLQWCLLKEEEVIPRILAMEGRRGRQKNSDPSGSPAGDPVQSRRKGRAADDTETDPLSNSEAKILRKLEAQGTALTLIMKYSSVV